MHRYGLAEDYRTRSVSLGILDFHKLQRSSTLPMKSLLGDCK